MGLPRFSSLAALGLVIVLRRAARVDAQAGGGQCVTSSDGAYMYEVTEV